MLGSIIRYGMAAWYGTLSVQLKAKINRMENIAMKVIIRRDSPSLQSIFEKSVLSLAKRVLSDPTHILNPQYVLLPSELCAVRAIGSTTPFSLDHWC